MNHKSPEQRSHTASETSKKESLKDYIDEGGKITSNPKKIKLLQKFLGINIDGISGKNTRKAIQKKLGFKGKNLDGIFGKKTNSKIKKYYKKSSSLKSKIQDKLKPKKNPETEISKTQSQKQKKSPKNKVIPEKKNKIEISGLLSKNGKIPTNPEGIKKLQEFLKKNRQYYNGEIDGRSGPKTRLALKRYQQDSQEKIAGKQKPEDYELSELSPIYKGDKKLNKRQKEVRKIYQKIKNTPLAKLVRKTFLAQGLNPKIAEQAVLVACSESNLKNIENTKNKNKTIDYGPIQVNSVHLRKPNGIAYKMGISREMLKEPKYSLKVAAAIYAQKGSWQPWYGADVVGLRPKRKRSANSSKRKKKRPRKRLRKRKRRLRRKS